MKRIKYRLGKKGGSNVLEIFLPMFVTSLLGVLLFINFVYFSKNTKEEKSTHNQTILGSILTFFFIFSFMYFILSLH
ncbi:phosphate starvation-inducible membrane PsiE [Bacillus niacini]|jgi:phosphate starvation-inducible membrane PsiE|uniref:Phosphate starvation-inducible membrane PsiE n=1 Tax=Neobacillus niacini TaxID=86668 RepID=A0A852TIE1_9BACI|nr:phosphate starvation-inducible membrane PsiE [Neobacillus niacini]